MIDVEICVDSVESAIAASRGGAERIELCSALSEEGITPSIGMIGAVRQAVTMKVFVIIRPRGGNFVYTDHEFEVMRKDILAAKAQGVDGVVLGLLTAEGMIDVARTRSLIELARPLQVTFHRAFDACNDLDRALEEVIACGADRILTSGGALDAQAGAESLARLRARAADRIGIMAGGGIRASNVHDLVLHTGVREVHTSLNNNGESAADNVSLNTDSHADEFTPFVVTEQEVRAFKASLETL